MANVNFYPTTVAAIQAMTDTPQVIGPSTTNAEITESFTVPATLTYYGPSVREGTLPTITVGAAARTVVEDVAPASGQVRYDRGTGLITFHSSDNGGTAEVTMLPYVTFLAAPLINTLLVLISSGYLTQAAADLLYQPLDSSGNLAALAGLTLAANKLPYATGAGTLALVNFPSGARDFISTDDAQDWRDYLELGTSATSNLSNMVITGGSFAGSTGTFTGALSSATNKVIYRWASNPRLVPTSPAPSSIGNGFVTFNATGGVLQYDLDVSVGDIIDGLGCFCFDAGDNTARVKIELSRVDKTTIATTVISTIYAGPAAGADVGESSGAIAAITGHTVLDDYLYSIICTVELNTSTTFTMRYVSYRTNKRLL
jgi:hypothetical protein